MTNRVLQPFAGCVAAKIDLDHQRQAGEEEPIGMPLAAEIAADKSGRLTAAAQTHRGQTARQVFVEGGSAVEESRGRTVRNRVGIAVGNDQNIARLDSNVLFAREAHHGLAIGDQMVADQPLGPGASTWATFCTCGTWNPQGAVHSAW